MKPILLVDFISTVVTVAMGTVATALYAGIRWLSKFVREMRELQQKMEYLWPIARRDAIDTLHHSDQPVFDEILDKYKAETLTEAERDQLIERAGKIASGEAAKPEQVLAAKLVLKDAEDEKARLAKKTGTTIEPGSLPTGQQLAVNKEAGKAMAEEGAASANQGPGEGSKDGQESATVVPLPVIDEKVVEKLDEIITPKLDKLQATVEGDNP